MHDNARSPRWLLPWLLVLLLPACSVIPRQPTLEGYSPEVLQQLRQQSAELRQLQQLDTTTPAQQKQIKLLRSNLQQFEREIIRNASQREQQNDWHGADQILYDAMGVLPDSAPLVAARQQLAERRQLREERVRMELELHRGEQLLKDVEAYQRLRQLQGPGLMSWLELKNFHRKRRASAETLHKYAERALATEDYSLAHRALRVAQGLYGDDLQQDADLRESLNRDLAQANRHLQPPRPKKKPEPVRVSREQENRTDITALKQALATGDLATAQQHLNRLQQRSPQHPQLPALQSQLQDQLNARVSAAIEQGNDFYSQGKIERALAVWRSAKALAPSNMELLGSIARAEKALENLRALSTPRRPD